MRLIILATTILITSNCEYYPIVEELKQYVESNISFAKQLNLTFIEANHGPNSSSPIYFTDMYQFFNDWLTIAPNTSKAPAGLIWNFTSTKTGNNIQGNTQSVEWFHKWLNQWSVYLDSYNSTYVLPYWYEWNEINMTEYIVPSDGYQSFNKFFYREINTQYRPIESDITSPIDGFVENIVFNNDLYSLLTVKNEEYNLSKILNQSENTKLFENATIIQLGLNLYNYHRFHSHTNGYISSIDQIGGMYYFYYPSNASQKQLNIDWAQKNRRGVIYVDNDMYGCSVLVVVGMGQVSSINVNVNSFDLVDKGDEIGYFAYGGSHAMLVFQQNVIEEFTVTINQSVIMGQQIAVRNSSTNKSTGVAHCID